ncbi:hypothetical protein PS3A_18900 [Pseudomonas sp. 3A(2025)]
MHIFTLIDWFKRRLAGGDTSLDLLDPPTIEGLIEAIDEGDPAFLRLDAWNDSLQVDVPMWDNSSPSLQYPETLTLFWGNETPLSKTWNDEVQPQDLYFMVPKAYLQREGEHALCYTVITSNEVTTPSEVLTIIIDKTGPVLNANSQLIFDAEVVSGGVSDAWLKRNGEKLTARVPVYTTPQPGDVITFYWSTRMDGRETAGTCTLIGDDIGKPIDIVFPGLYIRESRDGKRYASYEITDRTGNASSLATPIELTARVAPLQRTPPSIMHAAGSGAYWTLDPATAPNGATVVVPTEALDPIEQAFVQWDEPGTPGAYCSVAPEPAGTLNYKIPKDKLAFQLGKTVKVYYEIVDPGAPTPPQSVKSELTVSVPDGMPTLQCDCVQGGSISLAYVASKGGYANFTLPRWPFMGAGQFIRVTVEGYGGGQTHRIQVVVSQAVDGASASVPAGRIAGTELARIDRGETASLMAEVSFDNQQKWIRCRIPKPTITA